MYVDKFGKKPIYEQIIQGIEQEILSGTLKPQDKLPSVRALSLTLSVNPNTIQKAYGELERLGISASSPGQGRFVSERAAELIRGRRMEVLTEIDSLVRELEDAGMTLETVFAEIKKLRGDMDA